MAIRISQLERLKQMEQAAREAANSDYDNTVQRVDTTESFDFAYALQEAWPKLLAVVKAVQKELEPLPACESIDGHSMRGGDCDCRHIVDESKRRELNKKNAMRALES